MTLIYRLSKWGLSAAAAVLFGIVATGIFTYLSAKGPREWLIVASLFAVVTVVLSLVVWLDMVHTRVAALTRLHNELLAGIIARLEIIGVETGADSIAERLLAAPGLRAPNDIRDSRVLLISGPLGAGKTTAAEVILAHAMDRAKASRDSRIPAWLDASSIEGTLRDAINTRCRPLGNPASHGAVVVVDGVEQAGPRRAREILERCLALTKQWPNTLIVVTGRADLPDVHGIEKLEVPALTEPESVALIEMVAGFALNARLMSYPPSIQNAISRPLYAILLGAWLRRNAFLRPTTLAALVSHLVDTSLSRAPIQTLELVNCLQHLALRVLESDGRPVPVESVPNASTLIQPLLATGLVSLAQSRLSFPVAMFTEWFAGRRLLDDRDLVTTSDYESLYRWRYALVQALGMATHEQAARMLSVIVQTAPALGGWAIQNGVYDEIVPQSEPGSATAVEWAEWIASAMDSWRQAMGPLALGTTPTAENGQPAALGIRVDGSYLHYGWSRHPGKVIELPARFTSYPEFDQWAQLGSRAASDESLFEWLFTWKEVARRLRTIMEDGWIRLTTDSLQAEYDWHLALIATGHNSNGLRSEPIPIVDLAPVERAAAGIERTSAQNHLVSIRQIRDLVSRHRARGLDCVENPWPGSDRHSGFIPDAWTPESRLRRLQGVCEAALEGYVSTVTSLFPHFRTQLETFQMMPVRLRGYMHETESTNPASRGWDKWYLEPVPVGTPNSAVWTQVDESPSADTLIDQAMAAFAANRPYFPISGTVSYGVTGLETARPATNLMLTLLWRDLGRWGWVTGNGPNFFNMRRNRVLLPDRLYFPPRTC